MIVSAVKRWAEGVAANPETNFISMVVGVMIWEIAKFTLEAL